MARPSLAMAIPELTHWSLSSRLCVAEPYLLLFLSCFLPFLNFFFTNSQFPFHYGFSFSLPSAPFRLFPSSSSSSQSDVPSPSTSSSSSSIPFHLLFSSLTTVIFNPTPLLSRVSIAFPFHVFSISLLAFASRLAALRFPLQLNLITNEGLG